MKVFKALVAVSSVVALASGVAHADILLGMAGPITGPQAAFGEQMKRGVEQAVEDINAAGGVMGQKVKVVLGDDGCDPKQAVQVANKMVSDKVAAVIGHFCSGSSIPASRVYNESKILAISPASTSPKLTEGGFWNVFRVCGRDDQQSTVAAEWIKAKYPKAKVAVVHDKQTYSKGLAEDTKAALNKFGIKEVVFETITAGEKDYSALVTKLKAAGVDVLFYGGYHNEAGLILRQMREQGLKTVLFGGDALVDKQFWSITSDAGEGTLMTFGKDPRKDPNAKPLLEKLKAKNYDAESYTFYSYAAVQAWANAVNKAGSTDSKKVADALRANKVNTIIGTLGFDAKGDITVADYVVYAWSKGNYDYAAK